MQFLQYVFFALHMLGLAAIVGSFFVKLRAKSDFPTGLVLAGAITQLVSGLALVGMAYALGNGDHVNNAKIAVKLIIAVIVLVAAIVAFVVQRRGGRVQPAFHTAGGLAVVNLLVATLWH
ncbi:MAG: hypothetical protein J0G30_02240 [Actinomycetales bacterium]|nr:hypothetical protein [Actinomycetales bacterium]